MSTLNFQHATPGFRTFAGSKALAAIPRELRRTGARRVVLVHGASMAKHDDALDGVRAAIGDALVGSFEEVREHSPVPTVERARDVLREADADGIVVVGGGSAIVTARAATILLGEDAPIRDLCTRREADGSLHSPRLAAGKIPQWIVPSTPTTAYAKAGAAVRDPETGDRLALFDPKARAQGVILDPAVAATAPAALVTSAALNAFSMTVEGLQSDLDDPLTDALLVHAARLLATLAPRVEGAPDDTDLRLRLMLAALMSGQGSDFTGGGLAQALSHAAGPRSSTSNGAVEAILLGHAIRHNAPASPGSIAKIADALDLRSDRPTVELVVAAVRAVTRSLGVPDDLRSVDIHEDQLPEIVDHAMDDWALTRVPRPVTASDVLAILEGAR